MKITHIHSNLAKKAKKNSTLDESLQEWTPHIGLALQLLTIAFALLAVGDFWDF